MLPFPCSTVTSPCNFMSAMCMMSLLSFSQFRISSPINNNIGDGRKVHVQLDDEMPAGRRWKGGSCSALAWRRRGGPVLRRRYLLCRWCSIFGIPGWEKPTGDRPHSRNLELALPSCAAPAPASRSSWQPVRRWLAWQAGLESTERASAWLWRQREERVREGREIYVNVPTTPQLETPAPTLSISQFSVRCFSRVGCSPHPSVSNLR